MNAKELLECAPRLSKSNRAYVLFKTGDRGVMRVREISPAVSPQNYGNKDPEAAR